jgi:hypothetical protein
MYHEWAVGDLLNIVALVEAKKVSLRVLDCLSRSPEQSGA